MRDVIAIYGGTFDPPTNGHYHIIEKAVKIFNKVHIVVASNPDKKNYMFSVDKRVSMLQGMIEEIKFKFSLCDISVDVLSENTYLASFAHNISSKSVLVRGIRDEIDFSYEQKLCRTNKLIQPNIETIYIMPDDSYSLVSSSWIKGLIGCNGWRNIIEQNTLPNVAIEIKENYLRQIFCKLNSNISTSNKDFFWKEICRLYKNRKYHGYDHLVSMFEYYNDFKHELKDEFSSSFSHAIFLHDLYDTVDECIQFSKYISTPLTVNRLINATRHDTEEYEDEDEKFISSIDLLVLSGNKDEYRKYVDNVYKEYKDRGMIKTFDDWKNGRSTFLKNMLKRKNIFTFSKIRDFKRNSGREKLSMEEIARRNMENELATF